MDFIFILDLDLLHLNVGEAIICCVVFGLGSYEFWAWIQPLKIMFLILVLRNFWVISMSIDSILQSYINYL